MLTGYLSKVSVLTIGASEVGRVRKHLKELGENKVELLEEIKVIHMFERYIMIII